MPWFALGVVQEANNLAWKIQLFVNRKTHKTEGSRLASRVFFQGRKGRLKGKIIILAEKKVRKGRFCVHVCVPVMMSMGVGVNCWVCKLNIHTGTPFYPYFQFMLGMQRISCSPSSAQICGNWRHKPWLGAGWTSGLVVTAWAESCFCQDCQGRVFV